MANNSFIGIDIGGNSIKLVELRRLKGTLQLKEALVSEFEFDISSLKPLQTQDAIRDLTKALLKNAGTNTIKTCVSIWGQSAFIRSIKLPKVGNKKLLKMIGFEVQQQVPFLMEEIIWDYQIFSDPQSPEYDIILAAVKNKVVKFILEGLKQTNLDIEAVDANPLACLNAIKFIYKDESFIIVDIGAKSTNVIIKDSHRVWTRSIALAGNDITKSIMVHYNVDFKKAEELKKDEARALLSEVGKVIDEQTTSKELAIAINPILTNIVSEVSNSIGFYKSQFGMLKDIKKILITGGSSCITNIDKFFEYNLGIPTERVDLTKNSKFLMDKPGQVNSSQNYTAAIGLALRGFNEAPYIKINLLPPEEKILKSFKKRLPKFISLILVGIMAVFITDYKFYSLNKTRDSVYKDLNSQKLQLDTYDKEINQLNADLVLLREKSDRLNQFKASRYFWPDILAEITKVLPRELWLTNLRRDSSTIIIEGKAEGTFSQISEFKDNLERSNRFKNVEIISANLEKQASRKEQELRNFTIKMLLE